MLEFARLGVAITPVGIGETPVTLYARSDADGPIVVMAHGFAGSQQMMQGFALPLAQAGYRVFVFEFLGHGRHPVPMSGDVGSVDGTTRLLVDQTTGVIDAVAALTGQNAGPIALVGHSMATDILVRVADLRADTGPLVLISAFSQVIDDTVPRTLLLISGAWERRLRDFGVAALRRVDGSANEGETARNGPVTRRAVAAPFSEHVSILHSRAARREALDWLDAAYGRVPDTAASRVSILPTGWAIIGLLGGLVLAFRSVARRLPAIATSPQPLSGRQIAAVLLLPAGAAPVVSVPLNPEILPVLVADYIGLHLLVFGALQLGLMRYWGMRFGRPSVAGLALLLLGCTLFGMALDRYVANFWPTPGRLWIIAVLSLGALPYMIADQMLTVAAPVVRRIAVRASLLASLGLAVVLDFEGLFFLILIAPVMILFYLVFGTMGRTVATRSGPMTSGITLGLVLAWALGVSFPLFSP